MPVIIETWNLTSAKALSNGNSVANQFADLICLPAPLNSPVAVITDGLISFGVGGSTSPRQIHVLPYCDGPAGSTFSLRLYGWKVATVPALSPQGDVWIPTFLCELLCVSCERAGPQLGGVGVSPLLINGNERFCDTITLTQGDVGMTGRINSTGSVNGPTNLIAYALVDIQACRYVQFDFQQSDPVGMNAIWTKM